MKDAAKDFINVTLYTIQHCIVQPFHIQFVIEKALVCTTLSILSTVLHAKWIVGCTEFKLE